ncbi:MAG TPA: lysophospholipid acyltransferase family protein [Chitinophagaceae bacterium]|nr:lysophospholipid acyltransferase family protein [Chitinophagaceae bacterium]
MLLLFPLFIIASLFGKIKGGNIIYKICRFWGDAWFLLIGIQHRNIKDTQHDRHKQYIFVSNHISYLDIPVMIKAVRKQHMRILGKDEMAKIPLFGFIYKNAAVMVNRKDAAHRTKSVRILKSILKKNISVFICPEGTFNTTRAPLKNFYDGAFQIAIETQTPIKPIIFLDTYDRLNYNSIFSFNPGRSRAVYLAETITTGMTINDIPSLKEKIYLQMEQALIRYKASWIKSF